MEFVVQHVEACPSAAVAVDRVREALRETGLGDVEVLVQRVDSPEEAEAVGFRGSPTVLIDGVDPFGHESEPVGYACRIYHTETGPEGAPSRVQLATALRRCSDAS